MGDQESSAGKYAGIVVAGFISLAVAVGGGVAVARLTERRPALEYILKQSATFSGEKQTLEILTLDVSNPSDREVEALECNIDFGAMELLEAKVVGLSSDGYEAADESGKYRLTAPYLNPDESLSLQLLLTTDEAGSAPPAPVVEVRGRGVKGEPVSAESDSPDWTQLLSLVSTAGLMAVSSFGMLSLLRKTPRIFYSKQHTDDQRDVIAYVFDRFGFHDEAVWARESQRSLSYWAEADRFTEGVLTRGNKAEIERAVSALEWLLEYASIADTSRLLVHFDIARLGIAVHDEENARNHLLAAIKGRHRVILKRVETEPALAAMLPDSA